MIQLLFMAVLTMIVMPDQQELFAAKYYGNDNEILARRKLAEGQNRLEIETLQKEYLNDDIAKAYKSSLESFYTMQLKEIDTLKPAELAKKLDRFINRTKKRRDKRLKKCCHRREQHTILSDYVGDLQDLLGQFHWEVMLRWEKYTQEESSLIKSSFEKSGFQPEKYRKVMYLKNEVWVFKAYEKISEVRALIEEAFSEADNREDGIDTGLVESTQRKLQRFFRKCRHKKES